MRSRIFALSICMLMLAAYLTAIPSVMAQTEEHGSVYDYEIVSVKQTGADEITVKVQARYCPYCNPNYASNPGDPAFPSHTMWIDGRYIAVRIKDSNTGAILGEPYKLVCNPTNWPLSTVVAHDFIFTGLPLAGVKTVIVEADVYCSWCGHWYPSPKSLEIAPLKVCIDPGHGGSDPGAVGYDGDAYPNEEDINLDIALKLKASLEAKNIEVIMTRTTDTDVTLQQRCDIANNNDCDIFVSIHCNSVVDESAHGTETYYYPTSVNGLDLAKHVQSKLVNSIGLKNRGTKSAAYYVLKHTQMPAALTEVAFISNQNEFNLLNDSAFRQKAAQGITNGILKYFEEKGLTITTNSPVDILVTDPDGLTISKQVNEIPGATYSETDLDGDGDLDDQVRIPDRKMGEYIITVMPEPGALPTDMYTLEVSLFGTPVILAENVQIADIPSEPYIIESTSTGIVLPVIEATVRIEPETLNLNSEGVFTAFVMLPEGYDVKDIDVSTVLCEGATAVRGVVSEIDTGKFIAKFDRQNLVDVVADDEVMLTVTGQLNDGTRFEGSDAIRVINK